MLREKMLNTPPVFLCGFPSGGTDLLKTILNAHPDIHISGEMPFLYSIIQYGYYTGTKFKTNESIDKFKKLLLKVDVWKNIENVECKIDLADKKEYSISELLRIWFNNTDNLIWGNKTPQNSENITRLLKLFPEANFILIVRDVRDVCLSWQNKWGKNKYRCSYNWNTRMNSVLDELSKLDNKKYLIVKFEDLIDSTQKITENICRFLNITWSETMLSHHLYIKKILDGKRNYGKKIDAMNKRKWELSLSSLEIRKIEEYSLSAMIRLNYEPIFAKSQRKPKRLELFFHTLEDTFATIFVGNRASSTNKIQDRFLNLFHEIKKKYYS